MIKPWEKKKKKNGCPPPKKKIDKKKFGRRAKLNMFFCIKNWNLLNDINRHKDQYMVHSSLEVLYVQGLMP